MLKIKLFAIAGFLMTTAIVLSSSRQFTAAANADVLQEIAKYKTWQRINKEPIKVDASSEVTFIVDGQEVTNLQASDLGG